MTRRLISIMIIPALITVFSSCGTIPENQKGTAVGVGVGAATGAVLGQIIGRDTKATVIGGLVGALVGGVVGHYAYDRQKTREETAQAYKYKTSQGTVLTLEEASLSAQSVNPGDVVEIKMTYAVLNPSPETKTTITEIREITFNGELVGRPEAKVERADGTFTSTVPVRLPTAAKKGQYRVKTTIQSDSLKDTKELTLTVL